MRGRQEPARLSPVGYPNPADIEPRAESTICINAGKHGSKIEIMICRIDCESTEIDQPGLTTMDVIVTVDPPRST